MFKVSRLNVDLVFPNINSPMLFAFSAFLTSVVLDFAYSGASRACPDEVEELRFSARPVLPVHDVGLNLSWQISGKGARPPTFPASCLGYAASPTENHQYHSDIYIYRYVFCLAASLAIDTWLGFLQHFLLNAVEVKSIYQKL